MTEPKRTYITIDQEIEQRDRPGFQSVCCYGSIKPEQNEIGAIVKIVPGSHRIERGMMGFDAEYLERIFIRDQ